MGKAVNKKVSSMWECRKRLQGNGWFWNCLVDECMVDIGIIIYIHFVAECLYNCVDDKWDEYGRKTEITWSHGSSSYNQNGNWQNKKKLKIGQYGCGRRCGRILQKNDFIWKMHDL